MWFGITDMIQIACQISLLTCLAGCNGGKVCAEKSQCLNMHRHGWYTNFQCDKWKCKTFQRCYDNSSAHWLQGNSTLPKEALEFIPLAKHIFFTIYQCMADACGSLLSTRLPKTLSILETLSILLTPNACAWTGFNTTCAEVSSIKCAFLLKEERAHHLHLPVVTSIEYKQFTVFVKIYTVFLHGVIDKNK